MVAVALEPSEKPLISVVLPVFNAERYIAEAMDSILTQTYENLELIVVDDGSTDRSFSIVSAYTDSRVKILKMPANGGLVAALNAGVGRANGKFIARMDADDIAEPDRIHEQYQFLLNSGLDICGTAIKLFGVGKERFVQFPADDRDIKFRLLYSSSLAHPTVMGKAECFHLLPYSVEYPVSEDYDLWCRMAAKGYKFGNLPKPLLKYRVHPNQISVKKRQQQLNEGSQIAAKFALTYDVSNIMASALQPVDFGFTSIINLSQCLRLIDCVRQFRAGDRIGETAAREIVLYFCRKVSPMNPLTAYQLLKAIRAARISLRFVDFSYIGIQALLFTKSDSKLYGMLRALKR